MTRIAINDYVRVKLTPHGRRVLVRHVDGFNDNLRAKYPNATYRLSVPQTDANDCMRDQLWVIMSYFEGVGCYAGAAPCFEWIEAAP